MTNTNSHGETTSISVGHAETTTQQIFDLPNDVRELAAMTLAAKAKMEELQSTRAPDLRSKWQEEAAAIGMTVDEVLHGATTKKRGRKPKSKHE